MREILVLLVLSMLLAGLIVILPERPSETQLKKFSSYNELRSFLQTNLKEYSYGYRIETFTAGVAPSKAAVAGAEDYSTTNVQVAGVDEPDIIKNDGKYIYTVSGNKIVIVDAYPAEELKILSEIKLEGTPTEIFVNKDKLVVFGDQTQYYPFRGEIAIASPIWYPYYSQKVFIYVYDISDRENPALTRNVTVDGYYVDSRMIGDYAYAVINSPLNDIENVTLPVITSDETKTVPANEIFYFDVPDYSYQFTNIISLNTQNDQEDYQSKTILMGYTQNIFASLNNIYVTYPKYFDYYIRPELGYQEKTVVHRIAIENGKIEYKASGEVPGTILNQFSMDEYNDYFRIATTSGEVSRIGESTSANNIYILNSNLEIVGKLEDLAPGERIYSARFLGDRVYLVTFKKIDPLFVIDLSDPSNPTVLGKLKIPGFSDYLHPYDENHIIGIGKETIEVEEGNFAWFQGVKMSLFDVSDVENPKEISKYIIGDRGTDSEALQDHKAFLFSKSKNLLIIPILLADINEAQYPEGVPDFAYGDYVWQGAYVFNLDLENGFQLKGRVTHVEDDSFDKSGYYYFSSFSVRRSLFIDNILYTVSDRMIKANSLDDLSEINKIELPFEVEQPQPIPLLPAVTVVK